MYEEADEAAQKAEETPLKNRVLFHVAHKLGDEKRLMTHHQKLQVNIRLFEDNAKSCSMLTPEWESVY